MKAAAIHGNTQLVLKIYNKCGEGEQECWFGEGGCHESSKTESGS